MFAKWLQALLAGGLQTPDQYQAPILGGALSVVLTVAGLYKSTCIAVVLATPTLVEVSALLYKGFTVIDLSDSAQWPAQFGQHRLIFAGVT